MYAASFCSVCGSSLTTGGCPNHWQHLSREDLDSGLRLAEAFEDYARHETEQGNLFIAETWRKAADLARGWGIRAKR